MSNPIFNGTKHNRRRQQHYFGNDFYVSREGHYASIAGKPLVDGPQEEPKRGVADRFLAQKIAASSLVAQPS